MSFGTLKDVNVLREAIQYAQKANVVLVASAGNNNTSVAQYPAAYSGVLGTAATTLSDTKASFSNFGVNVLLDAPGQNIMSAYPGNRYSVVSGTSFSAPAVAGAAALVRSLRSTNVQGILISNSRYNGKLGYGRIDVLKSVQAAR
jgi:subtilisin family serine protease